MPDLLNNININSLIPVLKIGFIIADFVFIFFLIVMIKQVYSMDHIVNDTHDFVFLKTGAFLIIIIAVWLLLTALVIL